MLPPLHTNPDASDVGPLVSVLIPTYRQAPLVGNAIASALAQDYANLEVVVIDDHSPDETPDAIAQWQSDPRLRSVRNQQNLGRVANYHRAVHELARGEWVLLLDGDDFLTDPTFIRTAINIVQRDRARPIVFVQAGHRSHALDGHAPDVDILPRIDSCDQVMTGAEYLRFVFETGFFTHLGALYDRRRAVALGFYTAEISSSDMDSLLRLALEGEVVVLRTIAGCWVQHGANASASVPLQAIQPNVMLFRRIACEAVERGLASFAQLERPLRRYEGRTLAHLFGRTIGKTSNGPWALFALLALTCRINPRLLGDRWFLSRLPRFAMALTRTWLARVIPTRSGVAKPSTTSAQASASPPSLVSVK